MGVSLVIPSLLAVAWTSPASVPVVVGYESGVEAYTEALAGVASTLGPNSFRAVDLNARGGEGELARALEPGGLRLIIAVGSGALAAVDSRHPSVPVVAALVPHGSQSPAGGHVDLEIPLAAQLSAMRAILPACLRVGIIRNPARARLAPETLEARARKEGYTLVVADCDGPARLLKAMAALKGKVDFVLCQPDAELYNPVTIKPLVLASLEERLPLVGFSPAFVRAGAAAGIYPDYRDAGRQAAEMALRLLRGEESVGAEESPRTLRIALNQRVARLIGIEFRAGAVPVEVFR